LKRLSADDYREFLRRKPQDTHSGQSLRQQLMLIAAFVAIVTCYVAVRKYPIRSVSDAEATSRVEQPQQVKAPLPAQGGTSKIVASPPIQKEQQPPSPGASAPFSRDKFWFEGEWLAIGISSLIASSFLIYRFSRPKRPKEAQDPTTFADALEARSENILVKCKTPREVRRFLNYLRLVAAPNDDSSLESIQALRQRFPSFDRLLVDLATQAIGSAPASEDEIKKFYFDQCAIFGIDPNTFLPLE
jgi:hypothetical protein